VTRLLGPLFLKLTGGCCAQSPSSIKEALVKCENSRTLATRELTECKQQLAEMEESADKAMEDLKAQLEYTQQQLAATINTPGAGFGLRDTPRLRAGKVG
jgi:F0F1-type ATP synthase membrane subunit b/b'